MFKDSRKEIEQVLLTAAVSKRNLEFLTKEGITPAHFEPYKDVATRLWKEPEIPSKRIVEGWETGIKDWDPPDSEEVQYALIKVRERHTRDLFNREFMSLKPVLQQEDGWKTVLETLPNKLQQLSEHLQPTSNSEDIINVDDLMKMEFPPIRWAVQDIIPEGLTLMSGREKLGKSTLLLGLGVAVATGGGALSARRVDQGEVLGLFLEDNPRRLQKRIKRITLGTNPDLSSFRLHTQWPRVDQGGFEKLDHYLSNNLNTRLVIIDTLKMWRSSKGSNKGTYPLAGSTLGRRIE